MSNMGPKRMISLLLILLVSGCTRSMDPTSDETRAPSVLLTEFETVFYSKADLVAGSGAYKQLSKQDADMLRVPFADLVGGLRSLGSSASTDILARGEAILVGAMDFRPPTSLGSVQSKFCYIVAFGSQGVPDLRKYFSGKADTSASGNPVWHWSAPPQEGHPGPYTFYAAQVSGSYILVSNNFDQLRATAALLTSSETGTPRLADVRDWKFISQREYWGYRHYRHTSVLNDEAASGVTYVTPSAEDLIFFADPKQRKGVLRLVAADNGAIEKLNAAMANAKAALPPMKRIRAGVWEAAISFTGDQQTSEQMFDVMGLFGFAVYL